MDYKRIAINDNLVINLHNTDKFKTVNIAVYFKGEVRKDEVSKLRLLCSLLNDGCKKYPTKKDLASYKDFLYNLQLSASMMNFGYASYFGFISSFIDPRYLETDLLNDVFSLIGELLYRPLANNGEFDKEVFERVKNNAILRFKSIFNNKESYAAYKLNNFIEGDHPYKMDANGSLEELNSCTSSNVYEAYKNILNRPVELFVVGNVDEAKLVETVKKYIRPGNELENTKFYNKLINNKEKLFEEQSKFSQSQLSMVYTAEKVSSLHEQYVATIFNDVFGAGATSKLFRIVREQYNYCYTIYSQYRSLSSSYVVTAGIDDKNYENAKKVINEQLDKIKNSDFTDEDILSAKLTLKMAKKASYDSGGSILIQMINNKIDNINASLDEVYEAIDSVTKEEIVEYAKHIQLSYVYYLRQGGKA